MKKKTRRLIIFSVTAALSFLILFLNECFVKDFNNIIYILLLTIGVTLSTNAIAALISDKFKDNDINEIASDNFSVLKSCQEYGLTAIYKQFPLDDNTFIAEIENSTKLYLVMNDGKNFISNNKELLEKRLLQKKHSTTIIIQDYEQEDTMKALTRKNGHDGDYYVRKIKALIDYDIKNLESKCANGHSLNLYLNPNYNTLAILITDNYAIISIYRVAPGKNQVPHFVFKRGGTEYDYILQDVHNIMSISKLTK